MHAACHTASPPAGLLQSSISMAATGAVARFLRLPTTSTSLPVLQQLVVVLLQLLCVASALNQDGILLLSFKLSLADDPLGSLSNWAYTDATPCAWNGIVCSSYERVVSVVLPNAQLVGPVARELGFIEHLRHLDLSGNALNGTISVDLFRPPELRVLSLASNGLTGGLPEQVGQLRSLRALNLAGNALSGAVPRNLTMLPNLTAMSLANNFLFGELPGGGFKALQILDVSANLLNGSLPADLGGAALRYVNLSSNRIAGAIPAEMASHLPANVTIDLSYNNLTGAIPAVPPFSVQRSTAFEGNAELCGRPLLDSLCSFASSSAVEPAGNINGTAKSPPAIAAIPKEALPGDDDTGAGAPAASGGQGRMRPATILAIAAGDVAGIAVLFLVALYVYQLRKKRRHCQEAAKKQRTTGVVFKKPEPEESPDTVGRSLSACCLRKKAGEDNDDDTDLEVTDTSASFAANEGIVTDKLNSKQAIEAAVKKKGGVLVTVDGEAELELEALLKASAYILGSADRSIVYKAVLVDGSAALAVRRIGSNDAGVRRFSEMDAHLRAVAKLQHSNILQLRGFYWGPDEMLIIHEFAVNGSLANLSMKRNKPGSSSPVNLGWSARLRIARGVARGLTFLHDKKWVHGNIKPSNVLLDADMEPLVADLGIDRLVRSADDGSHRPATSSAAWFGRSKRSAKSLPDLSPAPTVPGGPSSASPLVPSYTTTTTHYRAPEAVARRSTKPNVKWDVYSFGVLLLELVAGRALTSLELCQCVATGADQEKAQALRRLADPALRGEMEGREEAVASCLRLGAACCAIAPNKRPSMRDALQAIERIPAVASAASYYSSTAAAGAQ